MNARYLAKCVNRCVAKYINQLSLVLVLAVLGQPVSGNPGDVDKGDFRYSRPPPWPAQTLDMQPAIGRIAAAAERHCATGLAAEPMQLGSVDDYLARLQGPSGNTGAGAVAGKLVGTLFGTPGGRSRPKLAKDPIKKKHKQQFKHPDAKARIQVGVLQRAEDLLLSARIAAAPKKNAFHSVFIETPDCRRIWPIAYEGYGLWGNWQLSVSVTKTTSRYKNGDLVSRSVDRSGWSKAGRFDLRQGFSIFSAQREFGEAGSLLNSEQAFLQQLRAESAPPAWQKLGYGKPSSGIRSMGARFAIKPGEIPTGSVAVVHLAEVKKGRYQTIGFPIRISTSSAGATLADNELAQLSQLDLARPLGAN